MASNRNSGTETESDITDSEAEYQLTSDDLKEAKFDEIEDLLPAQRKRSLKVNSKNFTLFVIFS